MIKKSVAIEPADKERDSIAAVSFDQTGTTGIGKFLLNHSFMRPGLVTLVSAVLISLLLSTLILN